MNCSHRNWHTLGIQGYVLLAPSRRVGHEAGLIIEAAVLAPISGGMNDYGADTIRRRERWRILDDGRGRWFKLHCKNGRHAYQRRDGKNANTHPHVASGFALGGDIKSIRRLPALPDLSLRQWVKTHFALAPDALRLFDGSPSRIRYWSRPYRRRIRDNEVGV